MLSFTGVARYQKLKPRPPEVNDVNMFLGLVEVSFDVIGLNADVVTAANLRVYERGGGVALREDPGIRLVLLRTVGLVGLAEQAVQEVLRQVVGISWK